MEDEKLIALLDEKFAKVDEQFANVDEQFAKVDEHFAKVDERFAKVDEQFAKVDEQFAKVDEQFAKVDEQFAKVDEQFAKVDERLAKIDQRFETVDEQFRQSAMKSERIEAEISKMSMDMQVMDVRIERLTDEVTLPSGRISQQFAAAQEHNQGSRVLIEQLHGKIIANGEQMDLISQKLDIFRFETNSRLDALESSRR